jgi:hypothetical protein
LFGYINNILYGIFALLILFSSRKNEEDKVFSFLIVYIFFTSMLNSTFYIIPRDKACDDVKSILIYWISDFITFSWYYGHFLAWRSYSRKTTFRPFFYLAVVVATIFLFSAIFYRISQFDASGSYLGKIEFSPRWLILDIFIIFSLLGALYYLVKFVLYKKLQTPHTILLFSTFLCFVQVAFSMKFGKIPYYNLYQFGLLIYILTGIAVYGYRNFIKHFVRINSDSCRRGDISRL